uniref:Neur_chan_LBD domain-containing protein n=1 Tax=Steinernema glaseri TaxID=37863 RepID=A0A1I7Y0N6_9BILA
MALLISMGHHILFTPQYHNQITYALQMSTQHLELQWTRVKNTNAPKGTSGPTWDKLNKLYRTYDLRSVGSYDIPDTNVVWPSVVTQLLLQC